MIVGPKIRGFICTTAHPVGCAENVKKQIDFVKSQPRIEGAKKVLIVGASTGYGLASRINSSFGCGAGTIGVIYEKPSVRNKTATAGWYNTAAFEAYAQKDGIYAKSINGDAFSVETKRRTIELIKQDFGKIDLFIYSLASPRRTMTDGTIYNSVLKTTFEEYTNKTIDLKSKEVSEITIPKATEEEIVSTIKVMGGEDWKDWITALNDAEVLEENANTIAYSYIGPEMTHPIYLNGTIGMAKKHLYDTANAITQEFSNVHAYISVNKALVTQSSAAIPIVPLYISLLYKVMKSKKLHEGCVEQIYRLYQNKLFTSSVEVDQQNQIRMDDYEMREDVQTEINEVWGKLNGENIDKYCDIDGYWEDFYQMFGFKIPGVSYEKDVIVDVKIPSISE